MDMSVIIAQKEELDEIYRDFAKDMEKYLNAMRQNVNSVTDLVANLRNSWVSDNYNDFSRYINRGMENVTDGLERGEQLRKVMVDQQIRLAAALEKLKGKYHK